MDPVGRTWYLKITRGIVNGQWEIGTAHLAYGHQTWAKGPWLAPVDPMTEKDVLDELYVVLMNALEAYGDL